MKQKNESTMIKRMMWASLLCLLSYFGTAKAQFYSGSINIPALATATLSGDLSMTLNRTYSLHANVSINPFAIEKMRMQHISIQPQIRWWSSESYRGFFLGGHAMFVGYHIGIPKFSKWKYEGVAYGGGIDVGYALPLSTKWNMEFEIGGSYLWADYTIGKCKTCSYPIKTEQKGYLLPTKLAVSLVYLF